MTPEEQIMLPAGGRAVTLETKISVLQDEIETLEKILLRRIEGRETKEREMTDKDRAVCFERLERGVLTTDRVGYWQHMADHYLVFPIIAFVWLILSVFIWQRFQVFNLLIIPGLYISMTIWTAFCGAMAMRPRKVRVPKARVVRCPSCGEEHLR